jgi:hypothetical protein
MVDVLVTLYEPTSQSSVGSVNDIYNANLTCKKQTEPPANVGILWYKNAYIYISSSPKAVAVFTSLPCGCCGQSDDRHFGSHIVQNVQAKRFASIHSISTLPQGKQKIWYLKMGHTVYRYHQFMIVFIPKVTLSPLELFT